ncbi:hypothetical protein BaRGS_00032671 [Batillaria attramentaria]|uniref:ATP-dependent DNA helicase PIF1 n=1 Tax=Batillaria attramentaria TaxID=370345 RepID=A0ABD0JM29_9CAEN
MQSSVTCSLSVEEVTPTGSVLKKSQHRNVTLTLGRDEFQEIQLLLDLPKKSNGLQLMLSNCPPDKLAIFIKTLQAKLEVLRQKGFVSQRKRLLSETARSFTEISPLTVKDLQVAQQARKGAATGAASKATTAASTTTGTAGVKRKWPTADGKENAAAQSKSSAALEAKRKTLCSGISPSKVIALPVVLNKDQQAVLEAVKRGLNVFFTGSAGTGKSFLLKRIIGALPPQHTFATASTGVAACHIGGTTLHSFAGIGSGKGDLAQCIQLASRQQVAQQWRKCHHLIIDEISMVDGDFFEKLETVARTVRKSDQPFGGIQLIVCGDFLQLPPVAKGGTPRFCFQSSAWHKCIQTTLELREVRRQSDEHFIKVLQAIRIGTCPQFVLDTLHGTEENHIERDGVLATRLCTHKEDVEKINKHRLASLSGEQRTFKATDSEQAYTSSLDKLCPAHSILHLKLGAQVLLCKNLDVQRGLVNGARGIVTGFDGSDSLPVVKFVCGVTEVIKPSRWVFKMGMGMMVARRQIPLKLAWAISIHKSQGMTLDCVEISLARVFESGQTYVALSRAKSLEGLRVLNFDTSCVRANADVLRFYGKLQLTQKIMQPPKPATSSQQERTTNSTMILW